MKALRRLAEPELPRALHGLGSADTLPLTPWAKLLMLLQSSISIVTLILVAARAVNMLG